MNNNGVKEKTLDDITYDQFVEAMDICEGFPKRVMNFIREEYGIESTAKDVFARMRSEEYEEEYHKVKDLRLSNAEYELFQIAQSGEESTRLKAISFILKTQGRHLGYGDKLEVDHGSGVVVNWVSDPKNAISDEID